MSETKQVTLNLSKDFLQSLSNYSRASLDNFKHGGITKAEWEESRSYAAEAILRLLVDNPQEFDYVEKMKEIKRKENE